LILFWINWQEVERLTRVTLMWVITMSGKIRLDRETKSIFITLSK